SSPTPCGSSCRRATTRSPATSRPPSSRCCAPSTTTSRASGRRLPRRNACSCSRWRRSRPTPSTPPPTAPATTCRGPRPSASRCRRSSGRRSPAAPPTARACSWSRFSPSGSCASRCRARRRAESEALLEPLLPEVHDEPGDDEQRDDADRGERAVLRDRVRGGLAAVVGDEPDGGRPHDAARRVPEEEREPVHPAEACEPGGSEAEDRDEAAEEHRLAAVPLHDLLAARQHGVRPASEPAVALEE